MIDIAYISLITIFLFIWTLIIGVTLVFFNKNKPIDKLKFYDEDYVAKQQYENSKAKESPLRVLSKFVSKLKINRKGNKTLEMEMMKADISITVEELLVIKIFSSSAVTLLFYVISKSYLVALMVFILIWNLPRLVIASKKKERIKQFDSQLTEGVNIISNSLKAGYSFLQAIAVVADETKDPFSKEFKKLLKEMTLGISEEEALRNMLTRMESEDLRLIMNAILIQKDIGGNLSEILDNISETIRERQKIKNELKTLTAQGKLSGMIVMLIPIFLGGTIYLFNKEYILLLFTTPTGLGMIGMAVFNQILGLIMIRKIINIEM